MYGATYRAAAYDAKVDATRQKDDITALKDDMLTNFQAVTVPLVAMETAVKQVLDGIGVPTIQYPFYLDFGREMFRKISIQEFSGESMAQWAAISIAKWVARGLTQVTLETIRGTVFSVGAPVGP